ncbi:MULTISPECIES: FecR family protein [Sphingobacterium]|uniref:FecR family protein n=1 Tax=Sphingobacterium TaxID=28453 RepID=UPI0013DB6818|nr:MULTISPECIES: FecR domain-containing protein [unclassified Sphingobacterium]
MMKKNLKDIIQKYLLGKADKKQIDHVEHYYDDLQSDLDITKEKSTRQLEEMESRIWINIHAQQKVKTLRRSRHRYIRWAAAVLLPLLLVGGYYLKSINRTEVDLAEVGPGKFGANLITETGQVYSLTSLEDLAKLEDEGIYREEDGKEVGMHEIVTPKGGYYQLVLSDGTSVWLNAATAIRFPARFASGKREVFLSGEAYFDVSHDKSAPFIVHTDQQSTRVLGTKFNITSYKGQQADIVTLIEGSVEATSNYNDKILMTPGHQAYIGKQIRYTTVENAEDVAAWRKGEFFFDNTPIGEVMTRIGLWYNIEVNLDNLPENRLNGLVNRNVPLKKLLDLIETTSNVKIIVKEGRLTIATNQEK